MTLAQERARDKMANMFENLAFDLKKCTTLQQMNDVFTKFENQDRKFDSDPDFKTLKI